MSARSRARTALTLVYLFVVAVWVLSTGIERTELSAQAAPSKLTTVLVDLVRGIPQTQGQPSPASTTAIRPFDLERLPKSAQDAVRGRKLRINANNEVQVYILLQAVTDENVQLLTANGATIEIRDAPHRRVQARVPTARLETIAALPFVNFVRLPSY